ncbi:MAG TPA: fumarylacetoacetase [Bacteroidia bacterium]|nr:fumarylacetoacetase [Bacteroidia bacterium]
MIKANDPTLQSWIEVPENSDFPIQNLPFGMTKFGAASIIGNTVINLAVLQKLGYFLNIDMPKGIFEKEYLNDFMALGKPVCREVRERLSEIFRKDNPELRGNAEDRKKCLFKIETVQMLMPVHIGDYTDFYSSKEHATNVGTMFRDPKNALLPNWLHLPVAYHGRASSVIVSGQNFHRPKGQMVPPNSETPVFGPSKALDIELEMAFIIGKPTKLGASVSTKDAEEYIFGMVLFNDWSARDIQRWEYVPLGPFLAKNFASTISPWIVTLDALEPFRVKSPEQNPEVLPYLQRAKEDTAIDINLEVYLQPEKVDALKICASNFKYMYWSIDQQLAHHTVNGCNINVGDMMASGTISGPTPDSFGSLLEITWGGANPIKFPDGTERKYLQDGDTVVIKGYAQKGKVRIGFGEAKGKVLPAL